MKLFTARPAKLCRASLGNVLAVLFLLIPFSPSAGQAWPDRPVRMIVPTPAGSSPDVAARVLAEALTTRWGQQVLVENRPGAGGINAMSAFVRAPADGYTLGFIHSGVIALTPHLFKNPQFDFKADVATVATVVSGSMVVGVNPRLNINTLADLIRAARAKPGGLVFAVPLLNSVPHVTGELLFRTAGIDLYAVPYNGAVAAMAAVVSGDGGDVIIDSPAPMLGYLRSGKIKAIAMTSARRMAGLEDVPTVGETLPNFEAFGWFAVFAPSRTPSAVIDRVNRDVNAIVRQRDFVSRMTDLGLQPLPGSVTESAAFVNAERDRWAKVLRDMGAKPQD